MGRLSVFYIVILVLAGGTALARPQPISLPPHEERRPVPLLHRPDAKAENAELADHHVPGIFCARQSACGGRGLQRGSRLSTPSASMHLSCAVTLICWNEDTRRRDPISAPDFGYIRPTTSFLEGWGRTSAIWATTRPRQASFTRQSPWPREKRPTGTDFAGRKRHQERSWTRPWRHVIGRSVWSRMPRRRTTAAALSSCACGAFWKPSRTIPIHFR